MECTRSEIPDVTALSSPNMNDTLIFPMEKAKISVCCPKSLSKVKCNANMKQVRVVIPGWGSNSDHENGSMCSSTLLHNKGQSRPPPCSPCSPNSALGPDDVTPEAATEVRRDEDAFAPSRIEEFRRLAGGDKGSNRGAAACKAETFVKDARPCGKGSVVLAPAQAEPTRLPASICIQAPQSLSRRGCEAGGREGTPHIFPALKERRLTHSSTPRGRGDIKIRINGAESAEVNCDHGLTAGAIYSGELDFDRNGVMGPASAGSINHRAQMSPRGVLTLSSPRRVKAADRKETNKKEGRGGGGQLMIRPVSGRPGIVSLHGNVPKDTQEESLFLHMMPSDDSQDQRRQRYPLHHRQGDDHHEDRLLLQHHQHHQYSQHVHTHVHSFETLLHSSSDDRLRRRHHHHHFGDSDDDDDNNNTNQRALFPDVVVTSGGGSAAPVAATAAVSSSSALLFPTDVKTSFLETIHRSYTGPQSKRATIRDGLTMSRERNARSGHTRTSTERHLDWNTPVGNSCRLSTSYNPTADGESASHLGRRPERGPRAAREALTSRTEGSSCGQKNLDDVCRAKTAPPVRRQDPLLSDLSEILEGPSHSEGLQDGQAPSLNPCDTGPKQDLTPRVAVVHLQLPDPPTTGRCLNRSSSAATPRNAMSSTDVHTNTPQGSTSSSRSVFSAGLNSARNGGTHFVHLDFKQQKCGRALDTAEQVQHLDSFGDSTRRRANRWNNALSKKHGREDKHDRYAIRLSFSARRQRTFRKISKML